MTSIRLVKELPPSPDRLFLGRSLFREDFVDVLLVDGYRVIQAAEPHTDTAIRPDLCHAPGEADDRAFFNSLSHSEYLAQEAQKQYERDHSEGA